jgi:hypothetical protein
VIAKTSGTPWPSLIFHARLGGLALSPPRGDRRDGAVPVHRS